MEKSFRTTCPKCGVSDQLEVVSGFFSTSGMFLSPDGFAFADAKQVETSSERVRCVVCQSIMFLEELTR